MKRPSFAVFSPAFTSIGKRFGFDAHYIAKNSVIVTTAHSISVLKGIITGYLVTLLFPPTLYGEYRFILSVTGTIGFVSLPGISSALAGAIARKESFSLARITRWYSAFALLGSLILLGCIPFLSYWGRESLWPLFLIGALTFAPSVLSTNIFGGVIRGTGEFGRAFWASLFSNVAVMIATLIMLLLRPSSVWLLLIVSGIPAITYLSYLPEFLKRFKGPASKDPVFRPAIQLSLATIPTTLSWYIDGLLISALFGLNQLALFSVALLIPEQVKVWMKELFPILFSKQAKDHDTPGRLRKLHKAVAIGTIIFVVGIMLYMLAAPFFIPILFPRYPADQLILLTQIAAITLITTPMGLYSQFLEARGLIRGVHISNWTASAVFVIALVTLIPAYGLIGAIVARGMFRFVYALCALVFILRLPNAKHV